jgi:hypothetical protein
MVPSSFPPEACVKEFRGAEAVPPDYPQVAGRWVSFFEGGRGEGNKLRLSSHCGPSMDRSPTPSSDESMADSSDDHGVFDPTDYGLGDEPEAEPDPDAERFYYETKRMWAEDFDSKRRE